MKKKYISRANEVMNIEIEGIQAVQNQLGEEFSDLVDICKTTIAKGGKIVFSGIGKSAHISRKLAATMASTGSPSTFLYPVEAMHGDLGMLSSHDLLIAISYSGETDELLAVLPAARRLGVKIIAICSKKTSRLAQWADLTVPMLIPREACPFGLAPTTSTTALLALGDALAVVLMEERKFAKEDFAKLHPAGAIGRAITLKITDVMRKEDEMPKIGPEITVQDALIKMTKCRSGSIAIVAEDNTLLGIFTDGDFRRHITTDSNLLTRKIKDVMTPNPITLNSRAMAVEALMLIEKRHIDDIIIVDDQNKAVGLIDIQDLPTFKLM